MDPRSGAGAWHADRRFRAVGARAPGRGRGHGRAGLRRAARLVGARPRRVLVRRGRAPRRPVPRPALGDAAFAGDAGRRVVPGRDPELRRARADPGRGRADDDVAAIARLEDATRAHDHPRRAARPRRPGPRRAGARRGRPGRPGGRARPELLETLVAFLGAARSGRSGRRARRTSAPRGARSLRPDRAHRARRRRRLPLQRQGVRRPGRRSAALQKAMPTLRATVLVPYLDAGRRCRGTSSWASSRRSRRRWSSSGPVRPPAVGAVLVGDDRAAEGRSCTRTAGSSSSTQGARVAVRPRPRRPVPVVHHHGLDDVELPRRRPARRARRSSLYDGSPGHPDLDVLWDVAARHRRHAVRRLARRTCRRARRRACAPGASHDLSTVRTLGSTGSPLSPEQFAWIRDAVGGHVQISSMSGGTDVCTASSPAPRRCRCGWASCRAPRWARTCTPSTSGRRPVR